MDNIIKADNPFLTSTAEKSQQKVRAMNIREVAYNLFFAECAKELPNSEDKSKELVERCFMNAEILTDFAFKQFEPFM